MHAENQNCGAAHDSAALASGAVVAMPALRVAYLEDDSTQGEAVLAWLREVGYAVDWFTSGLDCALALERRRYDILVLDWLVPDLAGPEVMQRVRQHLRDACPPIIVVSARDGESDIVQMLQAGASDYIVKPPSRTVLLARICVCLHPTGDTGILPDLVHGRIHVEFTQRRVRLGGRAAVLTPRENDLALYLFSHVGALLTRTHLANAVWCLPPDADTRAIDVYTSTLRRKLDLSPASGWRLVSIYGQGYRLELLPLPDRNRGPLARFPRLPGDFADCLTDRSVAVEGGEQCAL